MAEKTRLRDAHIHDHFGTLFALLLANFVMTGLTEFRWARALSGILELAMLAVAYFSTHTPGGRPVVIVLGAAGVVSLGVATRYDHSVQTLTGFTAIIVAVMYLAILIAVFRRVLAQRHVTVETILGALCVYFIVGLLFSYLYMALDAFGAHPVFGHPVPRGDYSYFSFITLTTVGYGDVLAATNIARRVAMIEAMTGQIFLATAVARLVSLYGADLPRRSSRGDEGSAQSES